MSYRIVSYRAYEHTSVVLDDSLRLEDCSLAAIIMAAEVAWGGRSRYGPAENRAVEKVGIVRFHEYGSVLRSNLQYNTPVIILGSHAV